MPTIPLGHFIHEDISVAIGLDIEDDFYCVHVRVFCERFGTAIVVIGIDGVGETYNLLVPLSRLRLHTDRVFNLRPVQLADRRPHIGTLFQGLPLPTLVLNLSDEEPEAEDEIEFQEGFGIAPPTADEHTVRDANLQPELDAQVEVQAADVQAAPLPPSVALAAAHAAVAHARGSVNEDSVAHAVEAVAAAQRSVRRRTE
jgi:hypothetical protein